MGCCCKKKDSSLSDMKGALINDENTFNEEKAIKLLKLCLQDDVNYSYIFNKMGSLSGKSWEELFKGMEEYNLHKIDEGEKYNKFYYLLVKLEDFQSIFVEWYQDESKYPVIKELWKKNYSISKLREDDNLLEEVLDQVVNDKANIRKSLRDLIANSPETKASDLATYLKYNFEDYYSLIGVTKEYKKEANKFEKETNREDTICQDKLDEILNLLIKNIFIFWKGNIGDKLYAKLSENIGLSNLFEKHLKNNISLTNVVTGYQTMKSLAEKFKKGQFFSSIMQDFTDYYNNPKVYVPKAAMLFLNLCTSIKSFYQSLIDYKRKKNEFTNRLENIHKSFEEHKKEIIYINVNNTDDAIKKIIEIGRKINGDKEDVIALMKEIEDEIDVQSKKKSKNKAKIVMGVLGVIGSAVGAVVTHGAGVPLLYGALSGLSGAMIGFNSADIVVRKKAIKDYVIILKKAEDEYKSIEEEIEHLKNLYEHNSMDFIPINVRK